SAWRDAAHPRQALREEEGFSNSGWFAAESTVAPVLAAQDHWRGVSRRLAIPGALRRAHRLNDGARIGNRGVKGDPNGTAGEERGTAEEVLGCDRDRGHFRDGSPFGSRLRR